MTSIRGRGHPRWKRPSVAPFVALPDSFPPSELGNKLFDQPAGLWRGKPLVVIASIAATNISKYSKDDLQKIFKTVLEAQTPASAPAPTPASIISKASRDKLKTCFPDIYYGKSHMDYYSNLKIILLLLKLWGLPKFFLPHPFLGIRSVSIGSSTSGSKMHITLSWSHEICSKRSSDNSQASIDTYWGKIKRDF